MSMSAINAANAVLKKAREKGITLTPLQLMKLTYIAHGFHLQKFNKPLFRDPVQAWQYGPVIPNLYQSTKIYGRGPINVAALPVHRLFREDLSDEAEGLIEAVVDTYGNLSGPALSNLTHKPGSPWSQVWEAGRKNQIIPNSLIQSHYASAVQSQVLNAA